jgi:hypothetical protein
LLQSGQFDHASRIFASVNEFSVDPTLANSFQSFIFRLISWFTKTVWISAEAEGLLRRAAALGAPVAVRVHLPDAEGDGVGLDLGLQAGRPGRRQARFPHNC